MRLFNENVINSPSSPAFNVLQVESYEEVLFDVYEVTFGKSKYHLEKISEYNGNPVVSAPIIVDGYEITYPFVLYKGPKRIIFHENNINLPESDEQYFNISEAPTSDILEEDEDAIVYTKPELIGKAGDTIKLIIENAAQYSDIKELLSFLIEGNNTLKDRVEGMSEIFNERIGDLIEAFTADIDDKISTVEDNVILFFNEKVKHLQDETLQLNEKTKASMTKFIEESRDTLVNDVNKLKVNSVDYIMEAKSKKTSKDEYSKAIKDLDKKIHDKFENYKVDLRKFTSNYYGGGGGTVAVQYSNGGTMNGDLHVNGTIFVDFLSANTIIGLSSGISDHNALNNLQGGAVDEYFHLTNSEYISLQDLLSSTTTGMLSNYQLSGNSVIRGDDNGKFVLGVNAPIPTSNNVFFVGVGAGNNATNANNSNFFGYKSGIVATNAGCSNFLGKCSGYGATNANNSNFFGDCAGFQAINAGCSNFIGRCAGFNATNACQSNFIGRNAGSSAAYALSSNFLGNQAGANATFASNSNFLGAYAGCCATRANNSNFLGIYSGCRAICANTSNFIGPQSGRGATYANNSNFFGYKAGNDATFACASNFLGKAAGNNANCASGSNFLGAYAGTGATFANNSNFIGAGAGQNAICACCSNFLGQGTGYGALCAKNSNFLGCRSGRNATCACYSNFIGQFSGCGGTNACCSNFIGKFAGRGATNACHSTFIGTYAGTNSASASASIALGSCATPTGPNQFVLGSAAFPLSVVPGQSLTTSACGLKVMVNGQFFTIPLI